MMTARVHDRHDEPRVVVARAIARLAGLAALGAYFMTSTLSPLIATLAVSSVLAFIVEARWMSVRLQQDQDLDRVRETIAVEWGAMASMALLCWLPLWLVATREFVRDNGLVVAGTAVFGFGCIILGLHALRMRRAIGMSWQEFGRRMVPAAEQFARDTLAGCGALAIVYFLLR